MTKNHICGVILSGGGSERMGRDKALVDLDGKPLAQHVLERFAPQVEKVIISGPSAYNLDIENVADFCGPIKGPIAGLYATALWAREKFPEMTAMVTVPVDAPFLPEDLVERLLEKTPSVARTKDQLHPTFANWGPGMEETIKAFIASDEKRSLHGLARFAGAQEILFEQENAFININSPGDLAKISNN